MKCILYYLQLSVVNDAIESLLKRGVFEIVYGDGLHAY